MCDGPRPASAMTPIVTAPSAAAAATAATATATVVPAKREPVY
jgi:hypothetical protein